MRSKSLERVGNLNNLVPSVLVLADREFDIRDLVGKMAAAVQIPASTKGRSRMTAHEIELTRKLAHSRIHVERVISMLCRKYTILNTDIPTGLSAREGKKVTTIDNIGTVSCACVSMCDGII